MRTRRLGRPTRFMAVAGAAAMILTACGDGGNEADGGDGGDGGGDAAQGGGEVSLLHAISGEAEQEALQAAIDAFEEQTGNTVNVEASPDFETVIVTRATGGNAPDVALYPQPGLLERIVNTGAAVPLSEVGVDVEALREELVPGMVETGTIDDQAYGLPVKLAIKSLLWYAADNFEEQGYEVPQTWEEMVELSQTMVEDGTTPWCIGIEAGGATGWVATDWIEDIMLRLHGADVYDAWVAGELPFDSPEVRAAFQELERIWMNEEFVVGGTTGILQTPFDASVTPMFDEPANCLMHRQAGFITASFPADAQLGDQFDFAYLPPFDNEVGSPVLFSGDLAAAHTDNPVAGELISFLASAEGQQAWMSHEGAGSLSVRQDFDTSAYPTDALAQQGDILANADFARFDASDLMPGEVGAGAFWTEMVAWISGAQDLDTTLQNIDSAWPAPADGEDIGATETETATATETETATATETETETATGTETETATGTEAETATE